MKYKGKIGLIWHEIMDGPISYILTTPDKARHRGYSSKDIEDWHHEDGLIVIYRFYSKVPKGENQSITDDRRKEIIVTAWPMYLEG